MERVRVRAQGERGSEEKGHGGQGRTTSVCPLYAASCSGVAPLRLVAAAKARHPPIYPFIILCSALR